MSTKSILKTVHIKDKRAARKLISALENSSSKLPKDVVYSRPVTTATFDEIRNMFKNKQ